MVFRIALRVFTLYFTRRTGGSISKFEFGLSLEYWLIGLRKLGLDLCLNSLFLAFLIVFIEDQCVSIDYKIIRNKLNICGLERENTPWTLAGRKRATGTQAIEAHDLLQNSCPGNLRRV